jgi:hypothetical protein
MEGDACAICGGDGRIGNAFGRTTTCPGCHGSGRRALGEAGLRDVTKTKPSHYRQAAQAQETTRQGVPTTYEGTQLATEVKGSPNCSDDVKARLIREIAEYETSHGRCTQTFIKKIRRQLRPQS